MNKRLIIVCSVMAAAIMGCSSEQVVDLGYDCVNETKCIDKDTMASCVNGEYKEVHCENECNFTTNQCVENECDDGYKSFCKGNYRNYCENKLKAEEECPKFCNHGKCVDCIEDSDCTAVDNAASVCSDTGTCEIKCDRNYLLSSDGGTCEPFVCKADDVSGCYKPKHGSAECRVLECQDGEADCSVSAVCDFVCEKDFVKTADGLECEPVACTESDLSRCNPPENATPACQITTCRDDDEDCIASNRCDFVCDDGYVKTADERGCEAFVCNTDNLSNCSHPEYSSAVCVRNRCGFECDSSHIKSGDSCIECTNDDISRCSTVVNASISCSESKCKYTCLEGCYTWSDTAKSCVMIDKNHDNVPDCYDTVNCDDKNIICLNTADDFIHLPDYFDSDGHVKPDYEGKYSGKSQYDVTFYLMNDVNLKDVVKTIVDPSEKECFADGWTSPSIRNLVLKTPQDEDKRIIYQYDINGETVNCSMNTSLWKTLDNSKISNLMLELNVKSDLDNDKSNISFSAFVEKVTNSELADVSWMGKIDISPEISEKIKSLGGIAAEAVDTKMRRVYCVNSSIEASKANNVGCVIGLMKGGDFSNESDGTEKVIVNRVNIIVSNSYAGGLIGKVEKSPTKDGKVSIRNVKNIVENMKSYEFVGGLIGDVSHADIVDVGNSYNSIMCSNNCGGLIGIVEQPSKIHDIVNVIYGGITGNNYGLDVYIGKIGGLIGAIQRYGMPEEQTSGNDNITEIYNIKQTVDNDKVAILGKTEIGGLIGSIYNILYQELDVSIHDVESQMPIVKSNMDENQTVTDGGLIGIGCGTQNYPLKIANVKNRVKMVDNGSITGGFIGEAEWVNFKNIDHQFESVTGYGQCGGFVAQANSCEFNDILNINAKFDTKEDGESTETDETGGEQPENNKNSETFLGVRNINKTFDTTSYQGNYGVGGFANLLMGKTSIKNVKNDVQMLSMTGNQDYSIGGFVNLINYYFYYGMTSFSDIVLEHVTNRVQKLDGACDEGGKDKKSLETCLHISGFSSKAQNCKIENVKNEVGEMTGYSISGFSDELQNAEIHLVDSRIKKMTLLDDMAGFSFNFYSSNEIGRIRSIVENVDADSMCNQKNKNCYGTGFVYFRRFPNSKKSVAISDIFSAYYINGGTYDKTLSDGFLYVKPTDNDTKVLLDKSVLAERCVTYSDMEYHSNDEKLKIKDAQVACVNFTPKNGSSIYYYAPDDTYTPFPDANSEYQCGDMCIGYISQKSVDEIVETLNGTKSDEHYWKKEALTIGESTVEMPVLELKNAGCISPICKDDEGTGDGGNDGGNDGG